MIDAKVRPGGPLPQWNLFEDRMALATTGAVSVGTRTSDGRYHSFNNGEQMVYVRQGSDRVPMVRLNDGREVSFNVWESARREQHKVIFDQLDPALGEIYLRMIDDNPELLDINLRLDPQGSSVATFSVSGRMEDLSGTIALSKSPANLIERVGDRTIEMVAELVGIEPQVIRDHPLIFQAFTLFHEFGHGDQYVREFLNNPAVYETKNPAIVFHEQGKAEMSSLLFPGLAPSKVQALMKENKIDPEDFIRKNRSYCKERGISTPEQLFNFVQEQYRNLPKEKQADTFSVAVLRKYWHLLA